MGWYLAYILIYFCIMFGIGFYYFTKVKNADDYLIAGWNMGFWPIVGTIISTWCGAAVFIGWVGMGFQVGLSGFFKFAFPATILCIVLIAVFGSVLRRQKLYTLADLFSERFGSKVGILPSVLSAFIYSVPTLALQMVGMSTIWYTIFGLELKYGILLSFVLILGFTILGGLPGTIITDAIQAIIIIVGIFMLLFASIDFAGGLEQIKETTPPEFISPLGPYGIGEILLYALSVGPFYLIWQSTWQRMFASRTEKIAKRAGITGFFIAMIISFVPFMVGMTAKSYIDPGEMSPDLIFAYVTHELLPPQYGGIIYVGLLAALMTGADSFILQGSSNLTRDLYYRLINPTASDKKLLSVSRWTVVIISVLGCMFAYTITDIASVYQWALRLNATTLVIPFLATMFWRRTTKLGIISSMLGGLVITLIWQYLNTPIDQTIAGFLVSFVLLVVVSLATQHDSEEQVKAVYWETLDSAARESESNI